ncbi:MAG TPA: AraC family transcriptional regulator [Candidatus Binataceae bacterium]|nr:AraC family transcriptional regulator [Candidatus Binataceae bacterium]
MQRSESGGEGGATATTLAIGQGWRVVDILCTSGPQDRPFEERHGGGSISIVMEGTFVYRSDSGSSLMAAGALLLGNPGRNYECSHHHGEGDHCLSFQFEPELFDRLAIEAGIIDRGSQVNRVPPVSALAPITTRAMLARGGNDCWEDVAFDLAASALETAAQTSRSRVPLAADWGRVSEVIRGMEASIDSPHPLGDLAAEARMSNYHFLRTFKAMTGVTPHQWLLRARLRDAAQRLVATNSPVTSIALDVGFDDLSNFIRSFRAEFGASPSRYRASA